MSTASSARSTVAVPWPRLMCLSIATIDENGRVNTQSKSCQYLQQW
jgi:hypothetical protein